VDILRVGGGGREGEFIFSQSGTKLNEWYEFVLLVLLAYLLADLLLLEKRKMKGWLK
jgi:hypothetical protein